MSTPEGRIKNRLNRKLDNLFGEKVWRFMPVQTGLGKQSLDYILCVCGEFISIETKRGAKHGMTDLQKVTANNITKAGGMVFLVYDDVSMNECLDYIRRLVVSDEHRAPSNSLQGQQGTFNPSHRRDDEAISRRQAN